MQGNSKLVIKQVKKEFVLKEITLVPYRTAVQKLIIFPLHSVSSISRCLSHFVSKIAVHGEAIDVGIVRRTLRSTRADLIPANPVKGQMVYSGYSESYSTVHSRDLKDFNLLLASFNFEAMWSYGSSLDMAEAKEEL